MIQPEMLTVREAAEVCRVSAATLYKLVRTGALRAVRFGRAVRIWREDLEMFLARKSEPAGEGKEG